jgi:hypothetical protein
MYALCVFMYACWLLKAADVPGLLYVVDMYMACDCTCKKVPVLV